MTDAPVGAALRPATPADADAVAAVHVASWRSIYAGLLPEGLIGAQTLERRRRQWRSLLRAPGQRTWVAELAGEVVGFCNAGPARDDDLPEGVGEVYAIYLLAGVWRRGLGRALWRAGVEALAADGCAEVAVWVLEGNERALAFYRSLGLAPDGWRRSDPFEGETIDQIRLRGPLA